MTLSALIHWAGAQIFRAFDKNKVVLGFLVIQLVWYILKQLFTSVSVASGGYLPLLRPIIVKKLNKSDLLCSSFQLCCTEF